MTIRSRYAIQLYERQCRGELVVRREQNRTTRQFTGVAIKAGSAQQIADRDGSLGAPKNTEAQTARATQPCP